MDDALAAKLLAMAAEWQAARPRRRHGRALRWAGQQMEAAIREHQPTASPLTFTAAPGAFTTMTATAPVNVTWMTA